MSLAYDYQIAIDAAGTLRRTLRTCIDLDPELWPSAACYMESLAWRLEAIRPMLESRRNRINPESACPEVIRKEPNP